MYDNRSINPRFVVHDNTSSKKMHIAAEKHENLCIRKKKKKTPMHCKNIIHGRKTHQDPRLYNKVNTFSDFLNRIQLV